MFGCKEEIAASIKLYCDEAVVIVVLMVLVVVVDFGE